MPRKNTTAERIHDVEKRLSRIETIVSSLPESVPGSFWTRLLACRKQLTGPAEIPVEPWKHLVKRPHPWRKQLYVKGKNLTARQLIGGMLANALDDRSASANYEVPVEAITEAREYVRQNSTLLETEAEIERLMLKREALSLPPAEQMIGTVRSA